MNTHFTAEQAEEFVPCMMYEPGWLISENDEGATLALSLDGDNELRYINFIPKGMIVSIVPLVACDPRPAEEFFDGGA